MKRLSLPLSCLPKRESSAAVTVDGHADTIRMQHGTEGRDGEMRD